MSDRRQRQKELRAAKKEAEKKKSARKELTRRILTAFGFGAVVVAFFAVGAVFDGDGALPTGYEAFRDQNTACGADQPPAQGVLSFDAPEDQPDLEGASAAIATIETSCGTIIVDLDLDFPETVNSFVFLAREGFYDGQVFHRVLENFVIQGGDPEANATGGPGYRLPDEFPPEDFIYEPGVVAMDNRGRGTSGSDMFIVVGDASALNPQFNVLGTVISGQDTIDAITEVDTARRPGFREDSLPLETIYIESITIDVTGS
ncbi:MAG: peptidylprolyl isomerase [Acidimicrobiia bacterium]